MFSYPSQRMFKGTPHRRLLLGIGAILTLILPSVSGRSGRGKHRHLPSSTLSQPFLKWGDESLYTLVPAATSSRRLRMDLFRGGPAGSRRRALRRHGRSRRISLRSRRRLGAVALHLCEPSDRTFRFFARSEGTAATVLVQVASRPPRGAWPSPGKRARPGQQMGTLADPPHGAALVTARPPANRPPRDPLHRGQQDLAHRQRLHRPTHALELGDQMA